MGAVLQCMFRVCCHVEEEDEDEDSQRSASHEHPVVVPSSSLLRSENNESIAHVPSCQSHQQQQQHHTEAEEQDNTAPHRGGVLFRIFRPRSHKIVPQEDDHDLKLSTNSPLRTACYFHSTESYPTLSPHEIVLPGSKLQHEMAHIMSLRSHNNNMEQGEECVICLEGFDGSNPRIPTQCGCGINQTYFHLPCLFQWIEQCEECPTCRQKITWREFC